jgi:hypothetical protein
VGRTNRLFDVSLPALDYICYKRNQTTIGFEMDGQVETTHKHAHFLTAQVWFFVILLTLKVVISMYGLIYSVVIALGHNNDQGVFNHSFNDYVQKHNIVGLSDRGYVHQNLVTPSTQPTNSEIDPEEWSTVHSKYRYPVEVTNAFIKNWKFAADRVKQSPEIQGVALIVIYGLTNLLTKTYPTLLLGYNKHK